MYITYGREGKCAYDTKAETHRKWHSENLKLTEPLEDLKAHARYTISKFIFGLYGMWEMAGSNWQRTKNRHGLLWIWWWNIEFHYKHKISRSRDKRKFQRISRTKELLTTVQLAQCHQSNQVHPLNNNSIGERPQLTEMYNKYVYLRYTHVSLHLPQWKPIFHC